MSTGYHAVGPLSPSRYVKEGSDGGGGGGGGGGGE